MATNYKALFPRHYGFSSGPRHDVASTPPSRQSKGKTKEIKKVKESKEGKRIKLKAPLRL